MKLWFVLRRFGASGIRKHVRKGIEYRKILENLIEQDTNEMFEIAAPPATQISFYRDAFTHDHLYHHYAIADSSRPWHTHGVQLRNAIRLHRRSLVLIYAAQRWPDQEPS